MTDRAAGVRPPAAGGLRVTHVGLADLLRLQRELPPDQLGRVYEWLGLGPSRTPAEVAPAAPAAAATPNETRGPSGDSATPEQSPVPFWRMASLRLHVPVVKEGGDAVLKPGIGEEELQRTPPLGPVPAAHPLTPWPALWPALQELLRSEARGKGPDVPRIVRLVASGRALRRLPRRRRRAWTAGVQVWVDRSTRLVPFDADQADLVRRLRDACGRAAIAVEVLDETDLDPRDPSVPRRLTSRRDLAAVPLLVLGDLGLYGHVEHRALWRTVGRWVRRAGGKPMALLPVPADRWGTSLRKVWSLHAWEAGSRRDAPMSPEERAARRDRLLRLACMAHLVEPSLLRAMRGLLPGVATDAGTEADVWARTGVQGWNPSGFVLESALACALRQTALRNEDGGVAVALAALIGRWHTLHPEALRHVEAAIWAQWWDPTGAVNPGTYADAVAYLRRAATGAHRADPDGAVALTLSGFGAGVVAELPGRALADREIGDSLLLLWGLAQRGRRAPLPDHASGERLAALLQRPGGTRWLEVHQRGGRVRIGGRDPSFGATGSPLGAMPYKGGQVLIGAGDRTPEVVSLDDERGAEVSVRPGEPLRLLSDAAELLLEVCERPQWAEAMWRDREGLWARALEPAPWPGGGVFRWLDLTPVRPVVFALPDPDRDPGASFEGFWHGWEPPAWASRAGRDRFGLWADVTVRGVVQRFRWVPPGRFWIGSPESEAGRHESEGPRHLVTLTRGTWVADTPVTQALWEAVMGENPSRFKSMERPVEQVSWEDCAAFIEKLNAAAPGLDVRLPTEAEWEHACRAGTETATWVGDLEILGRNNAPALDPIAWYGGNSGVDFELQNGWDMTPKEDGRWTEKQHDFTRGGSHPVKGKAPNPLGLYDMLGNVLEWCSDWQGSYDPAEALDPVGPAAGSLRVIRGGSWSLPARVVRAAYRGWHLPGDRHGVLGLRLARGQQEPEAQAAPQEAGPRSGPAARGDGSVSGSAPSRDATAPPRSHDPGPSSLSKRPTRRRKR